MFAVWNSANISIVKSDGIVKAWLSFPVKYVYFVLIFKMESMEKTLKEEGSKLKPRQFQFEVRNK